MKTGKTGSVIVFDLDDTLYPEQSYVRSGFAAVDQWLERERQVSGFYSHAVALFEKGHRGNIFDLVLAGLGIRAERELVQHMVELYRAHRPRIALHPDADWALTTLAHKYRLAILSDGYLNAQERKIEALGLDRRVSGIILSDRYGREHWKPSPTSYCKVVELFQCAHADCTYVSDNPKKDFVTARKLGWKTIHIRRAEGEYRNVQVPPEFHADRAIETLRQLPAVL